MGAADAIPGVSGGTIALITGIYEKLIVSIQSFDLKFLKYVRHLKIKSAWEYVNGGFLVTLLLGISVSLIALARIITSLRINHPIQIWSFFLGLIIISSFSVLRQITKWHISHLFLLLAGAAIAYYITAITPLQTPEAIWFIFVAGVIAICAMILPGISGAFILLLLGKYEYIYSALRDLNLTIISVFVMGCIVGILSFSRVISWMLKHFHNSTIAVLSGFMIGSLNKIWPWKRAILFRENSAGKQVPLIEENIFPGDYFEQTGNNPFILQAILFIALGILIVVIIEKIAKSQFKNDGRN